MSRISTTPIPRTRSTRFAAHENWEHRTKRLATGIENNECICGYPSLGRRELNLVGWSVPSKMNWVSFYLSIYIFIRAAMGLCDEQGRKDFTKVSCESTPYVLRIYVILLPLLPEHYSNNSSQFHGVENMLHDSFTWFDGGQFAPTASNSTVDSQVALCEGTLIWPSQPSPIPLSPLPYPRASFLDSICKQIGNDLGNTDNHSHSYLSNLGSHAVYPISVDTNGRGDVVRNACYFSTRRSPCTKLHSNSLGVGPDLVYSIFYIQGGREDL